MKKMSDELTLLTAKLMLCRQQREIIELSSEFGKLIERMIEQEASAPPSTKPKEKTITATIKFTKQEVADMAKTFKKEFIANGLVARIIKRQSGKRSYVYEIRYRRNGYNISASSTDLQEAKYKFLEMTKPKNIEHYYKTNQQARHGNATLQAVGREWLRSKKGEIDDRTYQNYEMNCYKRIFPLLGELPVSKIRSGDIKAMIENVNGRVKETIYTIFNGILFYALANGDITYNPMQAVKFKKAARKNRRALTAEEQQTFLNRVQLPEFAPYRQAFLAQYFFGLRPWETGDAHFEGSFLIALNAKHVDSNGEKVYKKIPVCKQARDIMNTVGEIGNLHRTDVLNRIFKRIMQDNTVTQYFLRHTFASVCSQFVRPDIVDIWMGDSSERLVGRTYTHFPDAFMTAQMSLVSF